ncbi:TPA: peptide deformylase [Patescibacteria group bacterium]|nr:MAG: Peptide deformylase [Parcubacteria group bacterium GW2011_GWF2_40_10]KKR46991.1 MAG: Peptide deformylase [Parcubacteria group bacterium GW2011_GWA2_40_143]KKR59188.1 MAG: Peptide deformylase [Parcubacteria group bacterium GW2011_GWC2_40_31]KKR74871.1 MAG: Peptide deformylase [Parcubacteria group bacterium GW2011_GWB2_40_8]KKR76186.1 MAG: Peptide deformylase [Parcubacteria group bacterium GW2011_GWE2_40_8]KKR82325.1 MAG: Peptide deformylase [Parcubacteria group bacterium GW2011_GWD2_40_
MIKIVQKGNKVLHQKAEEVPIDEIKSVKIKNLVAKMKETLMAINDGVAIAAPQIGSSLKVFIALDDFLKQSPPSISSVRGEKNGKKSAAKISVFINPKITKRSAKKTLVHEGCLSVTGIFGHIKRSDKVTLEAHDENGKKITRGASGLAAQIFQHEVDHLEGKLFTDNAINLEEIK